MRDPNAMALPDLFEALTADGSLDRLLAAACAEDLGDAGDVTTRSIIETDLGSRGGPEPAERLRRDVRVRAADLRRRRVRGRRRDPATPRRAGTDPHP
ncbi:MAG: hypothetical protein ACYS0D_14975 [Planctomycetota bacterium]